ncbi:L-fucose kinase-like [Uloborus diversus]|uniref:L-fucose kinase-like n=1 Tax=Uloborus diversus TaxID=327109 RepID=UPI0024097E56|nr:L-fucose kinase-like [Uloborus diversus]
MNAKLFPSDFSLQETIQLFSCDVEDHIVLDKLLNKWKSSDRLCISDILKDINYSETFNHRRFVYSKISSEIVKRTLLHNQERSLLPYFRSAFIEEWHDSLIRELDYVLLSDASLVVKTRTLSNMADLLSVMAGNTGVLRSGPGSNPAWKIAFTKLLNGDIVEGMKLLQNERSLWMNRPDHLMRAARHYERATQILIERSVKTVRKFIILSECSMPDIGVCITAECPARIDLQGGWSDTPPVCYELGGSVVNIAVLVDGKKPIGAQAFRTEKPIIHLKIKLKEMYHEILIEEMKDILNYDQPNAPGALLKAALIYSNIVDIHSEHSLCDQLFSKFGGGFVVQTWSLLPQGCGMGTSSILASAVISVLWYVTGKKFNKLSVVHAVLHIEQLLTTGGGWQDQVSGVMGGINRGFSEATLPLHVQVKPLQLSENIVDKLNSHLLLIYTGKVRLAKNLLQTVIRNWYARDDTVVKCFKNLITYSMQMKEALQKGDLEKVGHLMNTYWEQKKILAPGCEPANVKRIMDLLRPLCFGQLLVGAGGGGFMCILTQEENALEIVRTRLSSLMENSKIEVHTPTIDLAGLSIHWNFYRKYYGKK